MMCPTCNQPAQLDRDGYFKTHAHGPNFCEASGQPSAWRQEIDARSHAGERAPWKLGHRLEVLERVNTRLEYKRHVGMGDARRAWF